MCILSTVLLISFFYSYIICTFFHYYVSLRTLRESMGLYVRAESKHACTHLPHMQCFTSDLLSLLLQQGLFNRSDFSAPSQTLISQRNGPDKEVAVCLYVWAVSEVKTEPPLVWNCCLLLRAPIDRATIPSNLPEETLAQKERKSSDMLTLWVCVYVCMCKRHA